VLQRLVKDGYVTSIRGPSGGFLLKKDAKEITLLNIYESIEGKIEITSCPMDNPVCPFDKCLMGNVVSKLSGQFRDYMANRTLEEFLS